MSHTWPTIYRINIQDFINYKTKAISHLREIALYLPQLIAF